MRLFGFEIKRQNPKASPLSGRELTDDDREASLEVRRLNAERKRLQQQIALEQQRFELERTRAELQELRRNLTGDDDDDDEEEDTDLTQLMTIIMSARQAQQPEQGLPVQTVQKVHYTDEEIKQMLDGIPSKYLKLAKRMDDATIHKHILARLPNVDDDSVRRAITILRG